MGAPAVMVFTRDLRVRDNPALVAAVEAAAVVPLFVVDDAVLRTWHAAPNRLRFLHDSLVDLDRSLRDRGAPLLVRRGDWVGEVVAVARAARATTIHLAEDVTAYAVRRLERLTAAAAEHGIDVEAHPGTTVVPPGVLHPATSNGNGRAAAYEVFSPYHRRWTATRWRAVVDPPDGLTSVPDLGLDGPVPAFDELGGGTPAPHLVTGGETEGLARLKAWATSSLAAYDDHHDDLAADDTSRISAYVHFGCLSPLEVASRLRGRAGGDAFVRQLCWRDFFHQVLAAHPASAHEDHRARSGGWEDDDDGLQAWQEGRTGYPLVDAGMRQLLDEGWMHNRARLVTASFLTKDLGIDWREGARHFMAHLVDGDVANNQMNWQWVAGTGNDRNAHRVFNPLRQAERFDPSGEYVRRWVPELADLRSPDIIDPSPAQRRERGYPEPIVDHRDAVAAHRARTA